ncbi:MAG: tail fiber domain-containing protein, partial [Candidatus Saccharimonas sp.]|nr:tail fiber domain-containing protein [Planctomycetaceae bacterium]
MRKSQWSSRRVVIALWGGLVALAFGPFAAGAETVFTDDVRIQSSSPELIFEDNANSHLWKLFADSVGFDIFDVTSGGNTDPLFRIESGAPAYSFAIDPNGKIGLGTSVPLTSMHAVSDGPITFRMADVSLSGRTWDVEGGGLGFKIKDITANRTPFSILGGAPTNSLFVAVNGSIGIGTATPDANSQVDIRSDMNNALLSVRPNANPHFLRVENTGGIFRAGVQGNGDAQFGAFSPGKGLNLLAGGTTKLLMNSTGQISFGSTPPAITNRALVHQSGAHLTLGGIWTSVSSRAAKQDIEPITSEQARDTVRALQPVGYRYKNELDERYVGFIAEDVPELVATNDRKGLAPMDITAVLTKVVQDQDRTIARLEQADVAQKQLI